jgi:hypothetical protein
MVLKWTTSPGADRTIGAMSVLNTSIRASGSRTGA